MAVTQRLMKLHHFKETFSFDDFFHSLVGEIAPEIADGDAKLLEEGGEVEKTLQFPEAPKFQPLFKETLKTLGDLCFQVQIQQTGQVMAVTQRLMKLHHFKEFFSFDDFFHSLVGEIAPELADGDAKLLEEGGELEKTLQFPEAPKFQPLFKETLKTLGDLCFQVDALLDKQGKDVAMYEKEQKQTFEQLEEGVEALTESFDRLDTRVASVGQTAAKIGDHLESSDSQKTIAKETIDLVRYMMYFNASPTNVEEEPPLFSDDDRVSEATEVAQKLRAIAEDSILSGAPGEQRKSGHLDVAAKNLQAYCNELENRLLGQFDAASHKGDLWTMGDRAKILSQFNKGSSVMQRYVASRPMFMDFEVMNRDARAVMRSDESGPVNIDDVMRGLTSVYKEIAESVQAEAKTVAAVFPSPPSVMSIFVQRVMEQRVNLLIEKILSKPSLSSPPPMEKGGLQYYLRLLAGAYAKTKELANDFQSSGCGDLNVEAFAESLFKSYREDYTEFELTSLNQLHKAKMLELKASPVADPSFPQTRRTSILHPFTPIPSQQTRRNSALHSHAPISVSVVEEFLSWNEEAVARCKLLTLEPGVLPTNVGAIFACLLDQVSQYVTEGLERAIEALKEAAALRQRFGCNTMSSTNRKVASAVATAAEAAAAAGESSFRAFMDAILSASTNMAMLQRFFTRSVSRVLLAQEGGHAACCDAIASAMVVAENAALTGLKGSLETLLAEVERLLTAEQQVTDYKQLDDSISPEPTVACKRVVAYLTRMFEVAHGALDGLNRAGFMTQLGNGLYNTLIQHWKRFTFDPSGGLRLKRDVLEYADCVRRFMIQTVDEKFSLLGTMVNVFIVAPESLPTLVDGTLREVRDEVLRLIQLRDDYNKAKVAHIVKSMNR